MLHYTFGNISIAATEKHESLQSLESGLKLLGTNPVFAEQVHGNTVTVINNFTNFPVPDADGLITNNPKLSLVVRHADCLPVVFWHSSGVFGALHAGRKSTQSQISVRALHILQNQFDVTSQIHFWFGPAICANCYEIDQKTSTHFDLLKENKSQISQFISKRKYYLHETKLCTRCLSHQFHSYRAEGPNKPMNFTSVHMGRSH